MCREGGSPACVGARAHLSSDSVPQFLRLKRSLFGDMAVHGMEGVRFHTRLKTLTARWPGIRASAEYVIPAIPAMPAMR